MKNLSVLGLACGLQRERLCCCCMSQWISDDTRHVQWKSLTVTVICVCLRGLAYIMGCAAAIERQICWREVDRPAKELQCCALIWLKCTQRIETGEVENVPVILLIRVSLSLDGLKIFPMLENTESHNNLIKAFILNDTFSFIKCIICFRTTILKNYFTNNLTKFKYIK